jgi:phosphohistidine phosphatase SixA
VDVSRADARATSARTKTVSIYVVRHGKAGSRRRWSGPDDQRPLSRAGREQAEALVRLFEDRPLARLVSSPYRRCLQTFEPLAAARGIPVETSDRIAEGALAEDALALAVESAQTGSTALCTHGDVIELVLEELVRRGVPLATRDGIKLKKGSTWIFSVLDGNVAWAEYVSPQAADER